MSDAGIRDRRIAGVLLAGGSSTRMGRPKATLPLGDGTFVAAALRALRAADLAPLVLVCGAHAAETRAALPDDVPVRVVDNPAPERGQLSSLKLALAWLAAETEVEAAVVSLIDHPHVRPGTVARVAAAASPSGIVVPTWDGRRGHPVAFGREVFAELLATSDAEGARVVVRREASRVTEVATDDPAILSDVDTPEDLARLAATPRAAKP